MGAAPSASAVPRDGKVDGSTMNFFRKRGCCGLKIDTACDGKDGRVQQRFHKLTVGPPEFEMLHKDNNMAEAGSAALQHVNLHTGAMFNRKRGNAPSFFNEATNSARLGP
jgi:hypothetical protein